MRGGYCRTDGGAGAKSGSPSTARPIRELSGRRRVSRARVFSTAHHALPCGSVAARPAPSRSTGAGIGGPRCLVGGDGEEFLESFRSRSAIACALALAGCSVGGASSGPVTTANPILFVTQVPVVADFTHDRPRPSATTRRARDSAARGGDLWIRYPDGTLQQPDGRAAGFARADGFQGASSIAVREPCGALERHEGASSAWSSARRPRRRTGDVPLAALRGHGPRPHRHAGDHEGPQPACRTHNNVSPCYASDGRILFTSDRPRNGARQPLPAARRVRGGARPNTGHLEPRSRERRAVPDRTTRPRARFKPIVDSFGARRVHALGPPGARPAGRPRTAWRLGHYQVFNYADESARRGDHGSNDELFPEPRTPVDRLRRHAPATPGDLAGWEPILVGNTFNHFQLWTLEPGRHGARRRSTTSAATSSSTSSTASRNDDSNLVDFSRLPPVAARNRHTRSVLPPGRARTRVRARRLLRHRLPRVRHARLRADRAPDRRAGARTPNEMRGDATSRIRDTQSPDAHARAEPQRLLPQPAAARRRHARRRAHGQHAQGRRTWARHARRARATTSA